jgi:hypothetical protein
MEQVAASRTPIPGVLKPMENRIGVRERPRGPRTMLSPEMKRTKTVVNVPHSAVVVYPKTVPIPSKRVIKALYEASLEEGCEGTNENSSGDMKQYNDQQHLTPAGILSFEKVLLPAIGLEEEKALKRVQSKLQRDAPEYAFLMENCRRLVRESVRCAMHEVQTSRSIRHQCQKERKQQQVAETKRVREIQQRVRKEEQERLAKELARKRETSRAEKKRYLARENPRNQELWKEIVFLTSSVAQLEREERTWIQIEQDMMRLEGKQICLRKEDHPNGSSEQRCDESVPSPSSSRAILLKAQKNPLQIETEEKVNDIILTSTRIQKGLEMILKLLTESETLRKELYCKYKKDHVFRGYQLVNKPKSLIRFLSQSQDDHL